MCCNSSPLAVPSKCNFSFLQTELSHSAALCSGTVAVPSKQKAREVPILLSPLFSGPYVSRQDPSDVLVCSSDVFGERRGDVRRAPSCIII